MAQLPKPIPNGFETKGEAKQRRAYKVQFLAKGNRHERRLAKKLGHCTEDHLCGSPACDVCVGFARLQLYRESVQIFASHQHWTRASVITAGLLVPPGELSTVNLVALNKTTQKKLERSSLSGRVIFAGIDISLNIQDNVVLGWQLHLFLLIEGKNTQSLQDAIKATFPPEPTAAVPYDFDEVDPSTRITYLFKGIFKRRSRYTTSTGRARTGELPLKHQDLRELMVWLDQYPIHARLILRGVRRNGSKYIVTNKRTTQQHDGMLSPRKWEVLCNSNSNDGKLTYENVELWTGDDYYELESGNTGLSPRQYA